MCGFVQQSMEWGVDLDRYKDTPKNSPRQPGRNKRFLRPPVISHVMDSKTAPLRYMFPPVSTTTTKLSHATPSTLPMMMMTTDGRNLRRHARISSRQTDRARIGSLGTLAPVGFSMLQQ